MSGPMMVAVGRRIAVILVCVGVAGGCGDGTDEGAARPTTDASATAASADIDEPTSTRALRDGDDNTRGDLPAAAVEYLGALRLDACDSRARPRRRAAHPRGRRHRLGSTSDTDTSASCRTTSASRRTSTAASPDAPGDLHVDHGQPPTTADSIGDPAATVTGQHRYVLTYTLPNANLTSGHLALDVIGATGALGNRPIRSS